MNSFILMMFLACFSVACQKKESPAFFSLKDAGGLSPAPAEEKLETPIWPDEGGKLSPPAILFPKDFKTRRIYIDAGHAAVVGSHGCTSAFCLPEEDFNLEVADRLAKVLKDTKQFEAMVSRKSGQFLPYPDRLQEAVRWKADVVLSIHSDARGEYESGFWKSPTLFCGSNSKDPGFSILWSDHGPKTLNSRRQLLARTVAKTMSAAGFVPYLDLNQDYFGLYANDPEHPGVFVDRHTPNNRIFFLHRPPMPSVVIETHHALDPREAKRWQEETTLSAFSQAITAALIEFFETG